MCCRVYCWRARRLLAAKKLVTFEDMQDGDLSKVSTSLQKKGMEPIIDVVVHAQGLKRLNKSSGPSTKAAVSAALSSDAPAAAAEGSADVTAGVAGSTTTTGGDEAAGSVVATAVAPAQAEESPETTEEAKAGL